MKMLHPFPDDSGMPVWIREPHQPSPAATWDDPSAIACFVPDGVVPAALNGVTVAPWADAPVLDTVWEALAATMPVDKPPFACQSKLEPAAGALVIEPDGRAWVVAPTNRFGGHQFTLPKGRADGQSLKATALVEVFEEAGLRIRLEAFLCDTTRSATYTRFFLASRVGGSPSSMGWESQTVVLSPIACLRTMLTHPGDLAVLDAYAAAFP